MRPSQRRPIREDVGFHCVSTSSNLYQSHRRHKSHIDTVDLSVVSLSRDFIGRSHIAGIRRFPWIKIQNKRSSGLLSSVPLNYTSCLSSSFGVREVPCLPDWEERRGLNRTRPARSAAASGSRRSAVTASWRQRQSRGQTWLPILLQRTQATENH